MAKYGTQRDLAKLQQVRDSTVTAWKKRGKLAGLIRKKDGKINLEKAAEVLPGRISPKQQQSINHRWNKTPQQKKPTAKEIKEIISKAEINLDADLYEGQRLKTVYDAALKKLEYEEKIGNLIDKNKAKLAAAHAGRVIKENLSAIADRVAAICAAESDAFEIKKIIQKEVNFVLENISSGLLQFDEKARYEVN
jgi:hypothetical protein